jgi:flavin-dependent dehydrogenase
MRDYILRPESSAKNAMTETFDVLVAGGGPAGAAVALCLARQGLRVGLLEATTYDTPRYGETLPPEINPILRDLGLWKAFQDLSPVEAPGIVSVWSDPAPVEIDFIRNVYGPGWHIDRNRFDRMLVTEATHAGAQVYLRRRVRKCLREQDHWCVDEWRSRILVDASGRNGLRTYGDREIDDELLAIASSISYSHHRRSDLRTCIEATASGWWYTAPLPNGMEIAMFFTDPAVYREEGISIRDQLENAPFTRRRLEGGQMKDSRVLHVTSSCRRAIFGESWLAVGDSACSFDPISGRGIFKALRHANSAAAAIAASLNGNLDLMRLYAGQIRHEYDDYVRQRRLYYASERRWPEHPFWLARTGGL